MTKQDKSQIASLVYLLEDPDPFIQQNVKNKLMEMGEQVVPMLDEQKCKTDDKKEKERINDIIHGITFDSLLTDFKEVVDKGINTNEELEYAVFLLARLENPTLRIRNYIAKLDRLADVIRHQVHYKVSNKEKMETIINFVFEDLNFKGDTENYHHPENAFMNRVMEQRKGLPISLAMVVMFIGYRLNQPFFGINMPIHFMLGFEDGKETLMIDPFDKGKVVSYHQCYHFLKRNGIQPKPHYFKAADNMDVLARTIRNLVHSYAKQNRESRVTELQTLLDITEDARK